MRRFKRRGITIIVTIRGVAMLAFGYGGWVAIQGETGMRQVPNHRQFRGERGL